MACHVVVEGLRVDANACTRCGDCIELCPVNALGEDNGLPVLRDPSSCLACLGCMAVCSASALELEVEWVCGDGGGG